VTIDLKFKIIFYVVFDFIVQFCFIFILGKTIKRYSQYVINVRTIIATNYNGYNFLKNSNKYIEINKRGKVGNRSDVVSRFRRTG